MLRCAEPPALPRPKEQANAETCRRRRAGRHPRRRADPPGRPRRPRLRQGHPARRQPPRAPRRCPAPATPTGADGAFVRLAGGKACFVLEWSKINAPIGRPHPRRAGRASPARWWCCSSSPGPTPHPCPTPSPRSPAASTSTAAVARKIAANPSDYYVNIHTADFARRGHPRPAPPLRATSTSTCRASSRPSSSAPTRSRRPTRTGAAWPSSGPAGSGSASPSAGSGSPRPSSPTSTTGVAGVNGPVVVLFFDVPELAAGPPAALPATVSAAAGCVDGQDPALLRDIRRQPSDFYVNVHNLDFPGRGHPRPAPPRRLGTDPGGRTGPRWDGPQRGPSVVRARARRPARPSWCRRRPPAPARPRTSRAS